MANNVKTTKRKCSEYDNDIFTKEDIESTGINLSSITSLYSDEIINHIYDHLMINYLGVVYTDYNLDSAYPINIASGVTNYIDINLNGITNLFDYGYKDITFYAIIYTDMPVTTVYSFVIPELDINNITENTDNVIEIAFTNINNNDLEVVLTDELKYASSEDPLLLSIRLLEDSHSDKTIVIIS